MRTHLIILALGAALPLGAAIAQNSQPPGPPTVADAQEQAGPVTAAPSADGAAIPPVQPVPSSQAAPGAVPGPDGVIRQWGPQQTIVESVPPAPQSYPLCSRTRHDSCRNPDPSRELPYYPADKAGYSDSASVTSVTVRSR